MGHKRIGLTIVSVGALAGRSPYPKGDKRILKVSQIYCDKSKYSYMDTLLFAKCTPFFFKKETLLIHKTMLRYLWIYTTTKQK